MKSRESTIPREAETRLPDSLDRLIQLYTALDQPERVKKYRPLRNEFREKLPMPTERE